MIKIYTYANPYEIHKETFWQEIKDCPQFCVSQTMVNGMEETYPEWKRSMQLTTVRILLNALYHDWEDQNTYVRQMMEVDSAIRALTDQADKAEVQRSLAYNEKGIVDCIRIFQELGLQTMPFATNDLNIDQRYLVDIYGQVLRKPNHAFVFSHIHTPQEIDAGIERALKKKHKDQNLIGLDRDTIVLHGIHQFSPAMLCAIEDISQFKTVILLFNYQEQYHALYQTWMNIYSLFDKPIQTDGTHQFHPMRLMVDSYDSNLLAHRMGQLTEGRYDATEPLNPLEVIEFANMTEFAGYVARLFEDAQRKQEQAQKQTGQNQPVLSFIREQFYSASNRVNDILRAYFPEQFGERHFLDYPLGHFFVSATNMWDPETQCAKVESLSDLKECLGCGIISEQRQGQLINSLNQVTAFIEKESTLSGVIRKLKKLKKYTSRNQDNTIQVGYLSIPKDDLLELIRALEELEQIVSYFFTDFENGADNFRRFYQRIQSFIVKRVANLDDLDEEMHTVIEKLLSRMQKSDLPDTGTFICLRQTMSYYLSQDDSLMRGAHWIVRDFEQIDGDILRSAHQNADKTCYHFCCLSDKDICAAKDERLPWPLDIHFFEVACEPLDWKYQIFLKSKSEFRNFKKYALLYGLEFNKVGCKLSYVKSEHEKENDLFHLMTLLGAKVTPYREICDRTPAKRLVFQENVPLREPVIEESDRIKWAQCPYRFSAETLVQGKTIFRDRFLILNYIRARLVNEVKLKLQGDSYSDAILQETLKEEYQQLADRYHILNELEKTQLLHEAYREIAADARKNRRFSTLNETYQNNMQLREVFLKIEDVIKLKKDGKIPSKTEIYKIIAEPQEYSVKPGSACTMCSSKDICLKRMKEKY